jgi:hypothetical protein
MGLGNFRNKILLLSIFLTKMNNSVRIKIESAIEKARLNTKKQFSFIYVLMEVNNVAAYVPISIKTSKLGADEGIL